MRPRHVLGLLGVLLRPFAALLLLPAAVDLGYGAHRKAVVFALTAVFSFALGSALRRLGRDFDRLSRVEGMAVVAGSWLLASMLGAIPYLEEGFSVVDSLFESMSGFTTTGSTIFRAEDFVEVTRGLIFWRAMTQWLGGMGIIVLFVAVLPALAVAGRQMFFAEAPGPEEESLTPRIRHTAAALWRLYIGLTALEALLLWGFTEMNLYEGMCHAFTTLAAGGFSPHGRSLAGYSAAAQWIVIPFMFLAGSSFALQYRALRHPKKMARDTEFRTYAGITVVATGLLTVLLTTTGSHAGEAAIRHSLFQTASILTTTGYASDDFNLWAQGPLMVLGCLMFIGGCAGSAGGGPKVIRIVVLVKYVAREMMIALHPRAVRRVSLGGRPIPVETLRQIIGFFVAYVLIFSTIAVASGVLENDFRVGLTGSIVTLGNIGPGYGSIGPMETFADLSLATKLLFTLAMWIGRLEVMTVIVLFHPDVLRTILVRRRPAAIQLPEPEGE